MKGKASIAPAWRGRSSQATVIMVLFHWGNKFQCFMVQQGAHNDQLHLQEAGELTQLAKCLSYKYEDLNRHLQI